MDIRFQLVQLRTAIKKRISTKEYIEELKENMDLIEGTLSYLLTEFISELERIISTNDFQQAYDFVDAIHAFPDIVGSSEKNMEAFWSDFIIPYQKKWSSNYFEKYMKLILEIN